MSQQAFCCFLFCVFIYASSSSSSSPYSTSSSSFSTIHRFPLFNPLTAFLLKVLSLNFFFFFLALSFYCLLSLSLLCFPPHPLLLPAAPRHQKFSTQKLTAVNFVFVCLFYTDYFFPSQQPFCVLPVSSDREFNQSLFYFLFCFVLSCFNCFPHQVGLRLGGGEDKGEEGVGEREGRKERRARGEAFMV